MDPLKAPETTKLFENRDSEEAREELVKRFLPLAESLARRYQDSGQSIDDLVQVASVGLLKAVDRFDAKRGLSFESYAIPTILGELKRLHRDQGWSVHVPRRLQESALVIRDTTTFLSQELGRSPSISEIADHSHLSEEEVLEAMDACDAYNSISLDAPVNDDPESVVLADTLSDSEDGYEIAEDWAQFEPHLRRLGQRERRILVLRFSRDLTQSEIAAELGVSQMHVSRLLSRTLKRLRAAVWQAESAPVG